MLKKIFINIFVLLFLLPNMVLANEVDYDATACMFHESATVFRDVVSKIALPDKANNLMVSPIEIMPLSGTNSKGVKFMNYTWNVFNGADQTSIIYTEGDAKDCYGVSVIATAKSSISNKNAFTIIRHILEKVGMDNTEIMSMMELNLNNDNVRIPCSLKKCDVVISKQNYPADGFVGYSIYIPNK